MKSRQIRYFLNYAAPLKLHFYGNNVKPVTSVAEAYTLATQEPGVILLDMPVFKPEEQGLPADAKNSRN